jgi:hypothetical protein
VAFADTLDTFEDGNYTENPTWSSSGVTTINSSTPIFGTYSVDLNGYTQSSYLNQSISPAAGKLIIYSFYLKIDKIDNNAGAYFALPKGGGDILHLGIKNSSFFYNVGNFDQNFSSGTPVDNTAYKFVAAYVNDANTIDLNIYNLSDSLLASEIGLAVATDGTPDTMRLRANYDAGNTRSGIVTFDNVGYSTQDAPTINSVIINEGANLDGTNYDLNANISSATSVTYKCYSGTGGGSGCTSGSWDCKTGSLTNSSGDNWSTSVTGTTKDTSGTWTCKITAGTTSDSNTATMNELTGILIDSSSGTYSGNPNSTNNSFLTNQSNSYVVITNTGNVNQYLTATGTDLTYNSNTITLDNQKWYLTNDSGSAFAFTGSVDGGCWGFFCFAVFF